MGNKAVWITAENQCKSEEMLLSKLKFIETRSQQNEMLSLGCIDVLQP